MRRDIFHDGEIKRFQQGSLFYGAIVDNLDYAVWGVIITPRCDIEQNKVSTVNYLPIIKFADWKNLHLISIYQAEELTKRKANLKQIFESQNIPQNLLNVKYRLSVDDLSKIFATTNIPKNFIPELQLYWDLHDIKFCKDRLNQWKNYNNRISELISGRMERYLLLEHWDEQKTDFFVILLTEVKHLQIRTAQSLLSGVRPNMIDVEKDDLFYDNKRVRDTYRIVANLSSPYIEYICQKFSNAFFRIGIQDWPHKDLSTQLKNM